MKVGDVVHNTIEVLGNKPGTRGVIYEIYSDFDDSKQVGISVIFENGEYDGFSKEDQKIFLEKEDVNIPLDIKEYKFTNVMKLSQDFNKGFWDEIFR